MVYGSNLLQGFETCQLCETSSIKAPWHDVGMFQGAHQNHFANGQRPGWHDCQKVLLNIVSSVHY